MNDEHSSTRSTLDVEARIAGLSPEKRALLRARVGAALGSDKRAGAMPIVPAPLGTDTPLSFAQQRLWFMEQWTGDGALYNTASSWWLEGSLDVERLRGAFGQVVARHEALRTVFVNALGEPRQQVLAELAVDLPCVDLRELPIDKARARALEQAHTLFVQGFHLDRPSLLRVALYQVADSVHLLVLVMHHIISDGWSMPVLCRELGALYAGRDEDLPVLPAQYPDYAQWQHSALQGAVVQRQLDYWRQALAELTTLELPTDRPRPPTQSYRGARHPVALSASLSAALRQTCRREQVTLYQLLLAAFQVLLHRYSGQDDIVVGSPFAGRTRSEFEELIGFFVNMLVLRTDVSGNPSFRDLLTRVRMTAIEAYSNQDVPFERLVEELSPERDLSRNPLFQVVFVLQNKNYRELELSALAVTPQDLDDATAKFDLTLELAEADTGLRGELRYATDLFDAATIARMAGHFSNLLEGIVADPTTAVGELPLLSTAERQQLLVQCHERAADYPRDGCIHQLFEQQVRANPDAIALVFENTSLTYAELNARANQLAHQLIALGVGPEVPVGICLERSLELVIGLLGILKAGGAYVPLDPDYPTERLAFILADTAPPVLLTQHGVLGQLPTFGGNTLLLDRDWPLISTQPDANPTCSTSPANLAYIIYTSGSTGTPKGVMITHANVVRLFTATHPLFGFDQDDVWTCFHSPAFDFSVWEIWGALLYGGRLIMVPYLLSRDPAAFHALLRRERVTVLNQTPSAFRQLMVADAGADAEPELALRLVVFGGEALNLPSLRPWFERHGDAQPRLINMYGITETTVHVTHRRIRLADTDASMGSMIGAAIPDLCVYILDRHLQPVPIGVVGEIFVGGAGVARGYLNRAELTAERFIADPFSDRPGARVYRSGDLARRTSTGDLEYLGRLDHQVKLRGFRIELGEIEATLAAQPQVSAAVVVVREDTPGDQRLVAYVVAQETALEMDVGALRAALKRALPDYMIPGAFVSLPVLPLTPNGKIDRALLPKPSVAAQDSTVRHASPRDPIERSLCEIWSKFLGARQIGIDDNFFDLGGHSILAARMFAQLDQRFGRQLPLATLFSAPTIRELARHYRETLEPAAGVALVPITVGGSLPPLFAVPGGGGNVLNLAPLARDLGSDQPFYGLQSIGLDGSTEPLERIEEMAERYLREVRQIQPHGPYRLLGVCFGATVAFEMSHQLLRAGEEVAFLGLVDPSSLGGDLSAKPPSRWPVWVTRTMDFGRFVAGRLRLYGEEMRPLGFIDRVRFLRAKLQMVGEVVEKRDVFRGDHRAFNQLRTHNANLRALLRYRYAPLSGAATTIEIYTTTQERSPAESTERVDWSILVGSSAPVHLMPESDAGNWRWAFDTKALAGSLRASLKRVP